MKRARLPVILLALLAGCSGDEGDSPKQAYLSAAERVCSTANADLATAKKERPASIDGIPAYVGRIVEIARSNVDSLASLEPPAEDAAKIDARVLAPLREQLAEAEAYNTKVTAAANAKNQTLLFQLLTKPPTKTRADLAFMRAYGFKSCVQAADTSSAGT